MKTHHRKIRLTVAAALTLGLMTACAQGSSPESPTTSAPTSEEVAGDDEQVHLRFSWWGSPTRGELTQKAIDAFEDAHPDIKVTGEYADFSGYFDKLATSVAGGGEPDVITMGGVYHREYADRGVLLALEEVADVLDLDAFDPTIQQSNMVDGKTYAVPTGANSYGVAINVDLFEEAGVDIPDEDTWTWEDYVSIATELSDKLGDGVFGAQDITNSQDVLNVFARQRGEQLYSPEGTLAISAATVQEWFELTVALRDSGATPEAAATIEANSQTAPEQTLLGTGRAAIFPVWSNTIGPLRESVGDAELRLIKLPGESVNQPGMWLSQSQQYTISARSDHPKEAAMLVEFLTNDIRAQEIILTDRGLATNPEVRDAVLPHLNEHQQHEAEFLARVQENIDSVPTPGPVGSTETRLILERLAGEV